MFFLKAIQNLPEKIAVTANLSVDYKAPTRADQVRLFVQSIRISLYDRDPYCDLFPVF